jgi:hypothetical protein
MIQRIIVTEVSKLYLQSVFWDLQAIKIIPIDGMYIRLEFPDDEMLQRVTTTLQTWNVRMLCVNAENEAYMMDLDTETRQREELEYLLVERMVRMLIVERCLARLGGSVTFERIIAPYDDAHGNTRRFTCLKWTFSIQNALIDQRFTENAQTWINDCFYLLHHLRYFQNEAVKELTAIWRGEAQERVLTTLGNGVAGTVKDVHSIGGNPIYYVQLEREWKGNAALWLNAQQVLPTLQVLRQRYAKRRKEAIYHFSMIKNAIEGIKALQADRRLNPDLLAHTIENYQLAIQTHSDWLNSSGFPTNVSGEQVTVVGLDQGDPL